LVAALLLPAGIAFSQGRMADIQDAKKLMDTNPTTNNRLRLATLQYLQGVDYLKSNDMNNALDSLQASVWTLEDGKGQIPETNPVFEEARYGLGYALLQNNNPYEALLVLDQLVKADPAFGKAKYLLGATLINIPGAKSTKRAVDVMTELAQSGQAPYADYGAHAATRFAYDISTLEAAKGDPAAATQTLEAVTSAIGSDKGADAQENHMVMFAEGIYRRDAGDAMGAVDKLEALYNEDSSFQLANGVALSGVLSNAYYAGALDQLQLGGDGAQMLAVQMFDNAAKVGDPGALDVHHGKAIAYTKLGEMDKAAEELQAIVSKDPSYYDKIKK